MNGTIKRLIKKRRWRYDVWKKHNDSTAHDEYNQFKKDINQAMKARSSWRLCEKLLRCGVRDTRQKVMGLIESGQDRHRPIPSLIWNSRLMSQAKQKQYKSVFVRLRLRANGARDNANVTRRSHYQKSLFRQ